MIKPSAPRPFTICRVSFPNGTIRDAKVTEVTVIAANLREARKLAKALFKQSPAV